MPDEQDNVELARLSSKLSHQQVRYLVHLWRFADDRELAKVLGVNLDDIKKWKTDPTFISAIELVKKDAVNVARDVLTKAAGEAAMILAGGLRASDPKVRQSAADSMLDRTLGKAVQKVQNESRITVVASRDTGPFGSSEDSLDGRSLELDTEAGGGNGSSG